MIHVVLCDDHAIVRRGIRNILSEAGDIRVTGEAGGYAELRDVLRHAPCDVLLLDLNMPGRSGLEVLGVLQETDPGIKTIIVSMFTEDQYAIRCLRAGAYGYVNKAGSPDEILLATRMVATGRKFVSPELAQLLVESLNNPQPEAPHTALSERELQTLIKIAKGKRLSEIALELSLSPKTVSVYRARVMEKLNLDSNAALTTYALRHNLL